MFNSSVPGRSVWKPALALVLFLAPLLAADISGAWDCRVATPQGERPSTLTLRQEGEKLSGTFGADGASYKIEGNVKGDAVQFTLFYTGDGPPQILFEGKLEGNRISGQYRAGDFTSNWTAEKAH